MQTVNPSTSLRINGERSRTIKFFTLGCKVNQYDTQSIRERFEKYGFKETGNGKKADIYLINTCTVTSSADRKSRHFIHHAFRQNPKARIIVTGCLTELDGREIAKIPGVTHVIRNRDKDRIIELFNGPAGLNKNNAHNATGITNFKSHTRAFLKIQDGCNNFCSYCKVPLVRGILKSKPLDKIIQEAQALVKNGFKEIVLCGICLGAYGRDLTSKVILADVVEALEKIEGLWRIRLSSIEAGDISDGLIDKMAKSMKLCRHLHIPLQSGDGEILKKMNRKTSFQDYLNLIQKIKNYIPEVAITTDVLVGFPGEEEKNFKNTLGLINEIQPLKVHIFPFSPREGTAACDFKDRVNPEEIRKRALRLQNIAKALSLAYKKQFLNKYMDVLIEGRPKENKNYWEGHTDNYIKVRVKSGKDFKNQIVLCRLKRVFKDYILADLCNTKKGGIHAKL